MIRVLLWSRRENAVHVVTVEEMLARGVVALRADLASDAIPVLLGPLGLIEQAARALREMLVVRAWEPGDLFALLWSRTLFEPRIERLDDAFDLLRSSGGDWIVREIGSRDHVEGVFDGSALAAGDFASMLVKRVKGAV